MNSPVYLALDVGDARIGVAISRSGIIAEPLETIERTGRSAALDALQRIIETNAVALVVVGLPLLENGVEGEQSAKSRAFARSLQRRLPALKIAYHDERYSSSDARDIAGAQRLRDTAKGLVDRIAAAVILQEYLDQKNAQQGQSEQKKGTSGT